MASRGEAQRRPYEVDQQEETELPWEYLLYTATVRLGWSAEQFWDGSLRTLLALRDQADRADKERAKATGYFTACYTNGVDPDEVESDPKTLRKKELEMGAALW